MKKENNKIGLVLSPRQAVPSEYLGGVLGEASGQTLLDRSGLRPRQFIMCPFIPAASGRGILDTSNNAFDIQLVNGFAINLDSLTMPDSAFTLIYYSFFGPPQVLKVDNFFD